MEIHRCTEKKQSWGEGIGWAVQATEPVFQTACFLSNFLSGPNSTLIGIIAAYPSTIIALYPTVTVLITILVLCFFSKCPH